MILSAVYPPSPSGPYAIRGTFTKVYGDDPIWWATLFITLSILGGIELVGKAGKRNLRVAGLWQWPPWEKGSLTDNVEEWDLELWQEMEKDPAVRERLRKLADDEPEEKEEEEEEEVVVVSVSRD